MLDQPRPIFAGADLDQYLRDRGRKAHAEIETIKPDRLLNAVPGDFVDYLVAKYRCEPLAVDQFAIDAEVIDTKRDVRGDPGRDIRDRSRPVWRPATTVHFHVPFTGHAALFAYRASQYSFSSPIASVGAAELVVVVDASQQDADAARVAFQTELSNIVQHVSWTNHDVEQFNQQLRTALADHVATRRGKLLADKGLEQGLGYPIRKRGGVPPTYSVPMKRRRIAPPPAATSPYEPEPELSDEEYEAILRIMTNMVEVMERSPQAFSKMREEDLRHHFLVQLNGQYEGQATGETFNFEGKTDILIRAAAGNVFVAECKFWRGPKGFTEAVDQLLGYVTWRDTKTAILIFNRAKNITSTIENVGVTLSEHPNFKRKLDYQTDRGFRCTLGHRNDPSRELVLTVLVFDVPTESHHSGEESPS